MKDIVTEIIEDKSRVGVRINEEKVYWLSYADYRERPLLANDFVDLAEYEEWLLPRHYAQALNKAVAFLAVRSRSRQEVEQKLQSKGYLDRAIELALYKLEKEKLLDDEAFAREWAQARNHRHLGKVRILQELRQKGISRTIAEKACADLPREEQETQAVALACKLLRRYAAQENETKAVQKIMAAMGRRGFSYEEASRAFQTALRQAKEDDE